MRILVGLGILLFLTGCATILHYENYKLDSTQNLGPTRACSSEEHYGDMVLSNHDLMFEIQNFVVTDWIGIPFIPLIPMKTFSKASKPNSLAIVYSVPKDNKLPSIKWEISTDKNHWISGRSKDNFNFKDRYFEKVEFQFEPPQQGLPTKLYVKLASGDESLTSALILYRSKKEYYPLALGESFGWSRSERHFCK